MANVLDRNFDFLTNGTVTAAGLHNLIDETNIYAGLISTQEAKTTVGTGDLLLIADSSSIGSPQVAANRVTVQKLFSDTLTNGTFSGATITNGTIATLNSTTGTIATLNSTTGTIATLNSTTGTIPTLVATTLITTGTGTAAAPAIVPTGDANTGIFFPASDTIAFAEGGAEAMRIDSSGNVGIGTASPSLKLTVASEDTLGGILVTGSNAPGIRLNDTTDGTSYSAVFAQNGGVLGISADALNTAANSSIRFEVDQVERFRIDGSGNVGIGTTSPDAKLAIDAPGGSTPTAPISCNTTSGAGDRYAALFRYSGTLSGSVTVNGAAASYNTSSDYRLKTNLEPISNGIERIKQLPVYRFNWKMNEGGNKVDGFVAHEVTPIVREAIHGEKDAIDADGNPIYQGIDQSKIVPLLTAALKEAITKIEVLESKVAALEVA